jgi:signal transduction histidine kinase
MGVSALVPSLEQIGLFYEDILQRALETWRATTNVEALPEDRKIKDAFEAFIEHLLLKLAILGVRSDMVAIQLFRGIIPIRYGYTGSAILTCWAGPLSPIFARDRYAGESYPFLQWEGAHLRVLILGNQSEKNEGSQVSETFVTTLTAIQKALKIKRQEGLEAACELLLDLSPNHLIEPLERRRIAAKIVLESTRYTQSLMTGRINKQTPISPKDRQRLALPHKDERSILFIPVAAAGEPIGGAAVFSHYPIADWVVPLISGVLHLILYRFRFADELAAARSAASERARSETVLLYVQRLSHDVKKPAQRAVAILGDLIDKRSTDLPKDIRATLKALLAQLHTLNTIVSTRADTSIEKLQQDARSDARADKLADLLEDAVWFWRIEARKTGIEVRERVLSDPSVEASIPRYLVVEVLENLVSNAVRAAQRRVTVTAEKRHAAGLAEPDYVQFSVQNDGLRMPDSLRARLLSPNYMDDSSIPGRGIKISRFIVEEVMEGSFEIWDNPKGGLRVEFSIPEVS